MALNIRWLSGCGTFPFDSRLKHLTLSALCVLHPQQASKFCLYPAQLHMAAGDHAALIETCVRLGDAAAGGDAQLWTQALQYFGSQQTDCTQQARHALCLRTAEPYSAESYSCRHLACSPHSACYDVYRTMSGGMDSFWLKHALSGGIYPMWGRC